VVWLNSASGAALQSPTAHKGCFGPGLVFLERGVQVADTVDLRLQQRTVQQVPGLTQDGIPLEADLTIQFMLERGHADLGNWKNLNGPPYYYRKASIFNAIYGKSVGTDYAELRWMDLPTRIVSDVWRAQLLLLRFQDLFPENIDPVEPYAPLRKLQEQIAAQVKPLHIGEHATIEQQLLLQRGIAIRDVQIERIVLPSPLERLRVEQWGAELAD
jgi:hypothetical protein